MIKYYLSENKYDSFEGYAQNLKSYFLVLFIIAVYLVSLAFNVTGKSVSNSNMVFRPTSASTLVGGGIGQVRTNLYLVEKNDFTILADGVLAEFNNMFSLQVDRNDALKF